MEEFPEKDWKTISEAASREQDPEKLMDLVDQLNRVLGEREEKNKNRNAKAPVFVSKFEVDLPAAASLLGV